jgi:hypothetical protein
MKEMTLSCYMLSFLMSNPKECGSVQNLESPEDMLNKVKYDFKRHCENNDIYSFMDCLLSLNAIPEWIKEDNRTSVEMKANIKELIEFMKFGSFDDLSSIENKLRLIRLICNHSKHGALKSFPKVKSINGSSFPMTFPIEFGTFVVLGNDERDVRPIISNVIEYFDSKLCNYDLP